LARTQGMHWPSWIAAIAGLISLPFAYFTYFAETGSAAIVAYIIPAALGTVYIAVGFSTIQNQTPLEMRSVTAAINLFILNIVGLGLGPFSIGLLSDMFAPSYQGDSLRYALAASLVVGVWASFHYYRAGVHLRKFEQAGLAAGAAG